MKTETLNTIVTARILLDHAHQACMVDDKHVASAGLVMLQDAAELFMYACLIERGIDEQKTLDRMSFDQLIGELRSSNTKVPKYGTLKAMNKQRVIIKHYGQLAEPTTVRHYFEVVRASIDDILRQVVGKTLHQIVLYEIIKNDKVRKCLENASKYIKAGKHFDALVEVRKAIFLEVENEYSIIGWKDLSICDTSMSSGFFEGGFKAPWYTKNKEWIQKNVKDPFDYIQIDHDKMRIDLLEWGVSTQDFWNIWRLTPQVFPKSENDEWFINGDIEYLVFATTEENARYCLDRACSLILKKQNHADLSRQLAYAGLNRVMLKLKSDQPLYEKASSKANVVGTLKEGRSYSVSGFVTGLSESKRFAKVLHVETEGSGEFYLGYVIYESSTCEIIKLGEKTANE